MSVKNEKLREVNKVKTIRYILFAILSLSMLVFLACGGGGGSGSSSGGTGSVAVFLADGPADEYDHIWIRVKEVTLIPSEGGHVVVYKSSEGYKLDLLFSLRLLLLEMQEFLLRFHTLTGKIRVPT